MWELQFLGVGPGKPVPDRNHASIILQRQSATGREVILLDTGEPCARELLKAGISYKEISTICISHGHSDHIGGLPMVLQGIWIEKRSTPLPVYLPKELILPLKNWLEAVYLPPDLLGFPLNFLAWEDHPKISVPGGTVEVFQTTHLNNLKKEFHAEVSGANRFLAYGMDLCGEWGRIIYSGDIGAPEDLAGVLTSPTDILICEMAHFSPEALFGFLRDKPVKKLLLTHTTSDAYLNQASVLKLGKELTQEKIHIEFAEEGRSTDVHDLSRAKDFQNG